MEWIRKIIENAKIEEGKLDIDGVMKQINKEFPENAVAKAEFDSANEQLKTANTTIKELEKTGGENELLQQKVKEYEAQITKLKTDADMNNKKSALSAKLKENGVVDADYIIYKQGGIEKFAFNEENEPLGIEDILKVYKEKLPHLFEGGSSAHYSPKRGSSGIANPWAKESFNLTRQGEIFKENPAQARELAAQAGTEIF